MKLAEALNEVEMELEFKSDHTWTESGRHLVRPRGLVKDPNAGDYAWTESGGILTGECSADGTWSFLDGRYRLYIVRESLGLPGIPEAYVTLHGTRLSMKRPGRYVADPYIRQQAGPAAQPAGHGDDIPITAWGAEPP